MNYKSLGSGAAFALCIALLGAPAAYANVILTYTGNDFVNFGPSLGSPGQPYTVTDKVTATITLANPLDDNLDLASVTPIAFSLNDGDQTLTEHTPNISASFAYSTDSTGTITEWNVAALIAPFQAIQTTDVPPNALDVASTMFGATATSTVPGAWSTTTAAVPEPPTASVLGAGLLGLGLLWWRRRQNRDLAQ